MREHKKRKRAERAALEELGPPNSDSALLYLAGLPEAERAAKTDHVIFTLLGPAATAFTRPPFPGEAPAEASPPLPVPDGFEAAPMVSVLRSPNGLPGDFAREHIWTFRKKQSLDAP